MTLVSSGMEANARVARSERAIHLSNCHKEVVSCVAHTTHKWRKAKKRNEKLSQCPHTYTHALTLMRGSEQKYGAWWQASWCAPSFFQSSGRSTQHNWHTIYTPHKVPYQPQYMKTCDIKPPKEDTSAPSQLHKHPKMADLASKALH